MNVRMPREEWVRLRRWPKLLHCLRHVWRGGGSLYRTTGPKAALWTYCGKPLRLPRRWHIRSLPRAYQIRRCRMCEAGLGQLIRHLQGLR